MYHFISNPFVFHVISLGMKVPAIVAEAKTVLDSGHCVVIGLQTTGEVGHVILVDTAQNVYLFKVNVQRFLFVN